MINLYVSNKRYENDVYSLLKSFYPEEEIIFNKEDIKQKILENSNVEEITTEMDHIKLRLYLLRLEDFYPSLLGMDLFLYESGPLTKQYKKTYQRLIYSELVKITGKELPWGILTGIRPTKLVYEQLEDGKSTEEIMSYMKEVYLCSDDKINLSLNIAKREMRLLKEIDYKNGYSLYIGIPFCPSTCLYCSFTSYPIARYVNEVDVYLDALEKEMIYASTCLNKRLSTIYVGGGTPTTLNEVQLERLMKMIWKYFDVEHIKEFSVEAGRPDSITYEKLVILKKYKVDRISINPQTMVPRTLKLIGRNHTVEQIIETFHMAREIGHQNINMDIIIGLSGETREDVQHTLAEIHNLNPDSLTVHTLAIKRAAKLNIEKDYYKRYNASGVSDMLDLTINYAKENDYLPYYLYRQKNMAENLENIGYAKYGYECLYNILIMEEKQTIVALGAGSMSKLVYHDENRIERVDNVKSVTDYINRVDELINRKKRFFINGHLLPEMR